MEIIIGSMFVMAGIIHLLPISGVLGVERLAKLYGRSFDEPNLAILMRHRAVLFGLLGLFLIYAAFQPALQPLAFLGGFVSVISFLWLAWQEDSYNQAIRRVVIADLVALVSLLIALALWLIK